MMVIERKTPQNIRIQPHKATIRYRSSVTGSAAEELAPITKDFENFMSRLLTTDIQNNTAYDIAEQLIKISPSLPISFERAEEENEIVFVTQNEKSQNILVLDPDGDMMISHSPYQGNGWRKFVNNNELDLESVVYKFLSM